MQITIMAIGEKMPFWVNAGFADYQQRLKGDLTLGHREIPLRKRGGRHRIVSVCAQENQRILDRLTDQAYVITLDSKGGCTAANRLPEDLLSGRKTHA